MSRNRNLTNHEEPVINLTPLIDVVFVILIMFIVIAPLLELNRVDLADGPYPGVNKSIAVQSESPITIHVNQNNQILLNNQKVTIEQLIMALKPLKQRYPNKKPQLFQDKRAQFGTYQAVKNSVEAAGFQQMDIILKPQA